MFLFFGPLFYYYTDYKVEQAYADKLKVIYQLMDRNAFKAETIVSSYSSGQGVVSRYGEGIVAGKNNSFEYVQDEQIVQSLEQESAKCHDLLSELPDPPKEMMEAYSALLDAHITYKQYIRLALHPQEPSAKFVQKERKLKQELNSSLALVKNSITQL
ncbi:hypothetical protein AC623_06775 [Bacillus sp. FJAT-27231]|uniref:hypothetical protein n=1 Tax=Bacillus sp. FJAT-27231 TaxID=1679168 RepID=UPI000670EEEE|nr:hypothetical protein [Bacillus sp. FJAT-27231]KMY53735.1 hypothetical protein AC623_06775 [Bacillus sp. FJAT-27231]